MGCIYHRTPILRRVEEDNVESQVIWVIIGTQTAPKPSPSGAPTLILDLAKGYETPLLERHHGLPRGHHFGRIEEVQSVGVWTREYLLASDRGSILTFQNRSVELFVLRLTNCHASPLVHGGQAFDPFL